MNWLADAHAATHATFWAATADDDARTPTGYASARLRRGLQLSKP